jgi:predicted Zn-dependent peptidase
MQSASDRADKLSMFATYFRKPEMVNEQIAEYQAVSSEAVNRFVKERFVQENRAMLLYVPRETAVS